MKDHVEAHRLTAESLDGYAARGVAISRDSAHVIIAALRRDADAMKRRACEANLNAARRQNDLADSIGRSLNRGF